MLPEQAQSHFFGVRPEITTCHYQGLFGPVLHSAKVSPSRTPLAPSSSHVYPYPSPLILNKTHTQSFLNSRQVVPYQTRVVAHVVLGGGGRLLRTGP
jgi:hypothetical protein